MKHVSELDDMPEHHNCSTVSEYTAEQIQVLYKHSGCFAIAVPVYPDCISAVIKRLREESHPNALSKLTQVWELLNHFAHVFGHHAAIDKLIEDTKKGCICITGILP